MKKRKDPPGYPGDELVKKTFGENIRKLRLEKGWSLERADALLQEALDTDPHPQLPRAFGIIVRQLREQLKMSRAELSDISGLSFRFIINIERGKVKDPSLTQIVRLAMALNHPVVDFLEQVAQLEQKLKSS